MATKRFNYKKSLQEIEEIVEKIEHGEPDIDELSAMVKRAAGLIKQCKDKLKATNKDLETIITDLEE